MMTVEEVKNELETYPFSFMDSLITGLKKQSIDDLTILRMIISSIEKDNKRKKEVIIK